MTVGFSTGCLFRSGMLMEDCLSLYNSWRIKAVELMFTTPSELLRFDPVFSSSILKQFNQITIHAPMKEVYYTPHEEVKPFRYHSGQEAVMDKLRSIAHQVPIQGIVVHPDLVDDYAWLDQSGLPILLENMDHRKKVGLTPEFFEQILAKYSFGTVLDVQHAWEHDPSMSLAKELLAAMGSRLRYLHVSGGIGTPGAEGYQGHAPLVLSQNRASITDFLERSLPSVPFILEGGVWTTPPRAIAQAELAYVENLRG